MVPPALGNNLSGTYPKSRLIGSEESSSCTEAHWTNTAECCYLHVCVFHAVLMRRRNSGPRTSFSRIHQIFMPFHSHHLCEVGHEEWIFSHIGSREKAQMTAEALGLADLPSSLLLDLNHSHCVRQQYAFLWSPAVPVYKQLSSEPRLSLRL